LLTVNFRSGNPKATAHGAVDLYGGGSRLSIGSFWFYKNFNSELVEEQKKKITNQLLAPFQTKAS